MPRETSFSQVYFPNSSVIFTEDQAFFTSPQFLGMLQCIFAGQQLQSNDDIGEIYLMVIIDVAKLPGVW